MSAPQDRGTPIAPLDPANLTPAAAINRARLTPLPGDTAPPVGATAHDRLSAGALAGAVRCEADALGLAALRAADPDTTLRRFDRAFADPDPDRRAAADSLAARFGADFARLILTLRRGEPDARVARPDWDGSYWAHWAGITAVYLGGGIVSGHLKPRLVAHAARALADAGMTDCALTLADRPALLPLLGAARSVPAPHRAAIVCDFGQTTVKRALAGYDTTGLATLRVLPALHAPRMAHPPATGAPPEDVRDLADALVTILAEGWHAAAALAPDLAPLVVAGIAAYLRDGQPLARRGAPYGTLATLSSNLTRWLTDRLTAAIGRPLAVALLHDGTAAARACAGAHHTAVITLGTALGVGFPPPATNLRPLASRFSVP